MGVIWIFGGTSEGRELAGYCAKHRLPVAVSVATEYGEAILTDGAYGDIRQGRMDEVQMRDYIRSQNVELVLDATHPYAVDVTANIRRACEAEAIEYIRVLRGSAAGGAGSDKAVWVDSVMEAAEYLAGTEGNIMLATGSKELPVFCERIDRQRLYPRVLPSRESIGICEANGIPASNCIAMQGPFSEAVNLALLEQFGCTCLVTKESGTAGGFEEKLSACQKAGATAVVIRRPTVEHGLDFEAACGYLAQRYGLHPDGADGLTQEAQNSCGVRMPMQIDIVGIGMGTEKTMTEEVKTILNQADVLIGGKRMLEGYRDSGKVLFDCYQAEAIREFVDSCQAADSGAVDSGAADSGAGENGRGSRRVAILMSGDVGFYSGAKRLADVLKGYPVRLHPGISSVVYMASKIGIPWQDMVLCSVHGRNQNVIGKIRTHEKVFTLAGSGEEILQICGELVQSGMTRTEVYVGEDLSYDTEKIWYGSPEACLQETFGKLCVAVFCNPDYRNATVASSIPDEAFIRGKVPMTKEEIRTISISKLRLTRQSVVYDIGAGTGSVSVEAALAAEDGMVYAIEKKEEAAGLIEANARAFGAANLTVIRGTAPEALCGLPKPTHAFIGGSSGNLKDIISVLRTRNPAVRIVVNAIALETIAELTELAKTYETELITVTVAKANPVGTYHLMMGQNPVMIGTVGKER